MNGYWNRQYYSMGTLLSLSLTEGQIYMRYQREYKASYIPSELINASRGNIRLISPLMRAYHGQANSINV